MPPEALARASDFGAQIQVAAKDKIHGRKRAQLCLRAIALKGKCERKPIERQKERSAEAS